MSKGSTQTEVLFLRASPEWRRRVEEWRRRQSPIPSEADAVRRLVDKALGYETEPVRRGRRKVAELTTAA